MSQPIQISSYEDYLKYVGKKARGRTMEAYPRFQYSVFLGGGREEQVVIRAASLEEFNQLKEEIAALMNKPSQKQGALNSLARPRSAPSAGKRQSIEKAFLKRLTNPTRGSSALTRTAITPGSCEACLLGCVNSHPSSGGFI